MELPDSSSGSPWFKPKWDHNKPLTLDGAGGFVLVPAWKCCTQRRGLSGM